MRLWARTKQPDALETQRSFEKAVQKIYGRERITLALAEIHHFEGYNVKLHGRDISGPSQFEMLGVVHEHPNDTRIFCHLNFVDDFDTSTTRSEDSIGQCVLTSGVDDSASARGVDRQEKEHILDVTIFDRALIRWQRAIEIFRDAAVSNFRFVHFELVTEEGGTVEAATSEYQSKGYGPTKAILALKMWPKIVLPNAPNWALTRTLT